MAPSIPPTFLIWGANGWIAGKLYKMLGDQRKNVKVTSVRMEDQAAVRQVLDDINPTHVINCAGKTGRPNIDWCEDHKMETMDTNVFGTILLARECRDRGVHLTVLATGCIYRSDYNEDMTQVMSPPFTEEDTPNFNGSYYSRGKANVEDTLKDVPQVCILRIRMPVSDDLHHRSFVTKITKYERVVDVPNSHTILHDLLPMVIQLSEHNEVGVYNFTNPGAISHNGVLELYRDIVDPSYSWKNFTMEEQSHVVKADRSNCELDPTKLMAKVKQYQSEGHDVEVPEIREAYRRCFERMKVNLKPIEEADGRASEKVNEEATMQQQGGAVMVAS